MAMGLAVSPPDAARAIVGSNRDGAAFSDRVVMILTRGPQGSGFCTGVVLAPRVVLTAAHCLRPASDMLVHFRDDAGAPVFIPVEASQAHPRYRPEAMTARVVSIDLGLIETQRPLPPSFRAVGLSQVDRPPIGSSATVVGFGVGREGTSKSGGVLRAVTLAVREPASQILLWAGDTARGGGACSGDSGGPILADDGETLLAIVAWTNGTAGHKCGDITQGPLIGPLREWIGSVLARWRL